MLLAATVPRLRLSSCPDVLRVIRLWLISCPAWLLIAALRRNSRLPPLASLPLVLVRLPSRSSVISALLLRLPALLSRLLPSKLKPCCAVRLPAALFRALALMVSPAPLSIRPFWLLFSRPATVRVWPVPLERMPPLLSRLSAVTLSVFWLTNAPLPPLSNSPVRVVTRLPLRLDKVPLVRLSSRLPETFRPCQPEIRPFWLSRLVALTVSTLLLISLPLLLLRVRPSNLKLCALETSPDWLFRSRMRLRVSEPSAVIKPPRLLRSLPCMSMDNPASPITRPPLSDSALRTRVMSRVADTSPLLPASRLPAVRFRVPVLLIRPLAMLLIDVALRIRLVPPSTWPFWLSRLAVPTLSA
ncbi:Uncharacterized protein AC517_0540 [Pseudomonas syringae pv. syringae]|nr:Uncharacterized protein AC517_0540 [Pseudomonas syringae pv. syringae]